MMKTLLCLLITIITVTACDKVPLASQRAKDFFPGLQYQQKYIHGTSDVPLFKGFKVIEGKTLFYDTAKGRIIEAQYISKYAVAGQVREFYHQTLPQLGWSQQSARTYLRDNERLTYSLHEQGKKLLLKVIIQPQNH